MCIFVLWQCEPFCPKGKVQTFLSISTKQGWLQTHKYKYENYSQKYPQLLKNNQCLKTEV